MNTDCVCTLYSLNISFSFFDVFLLYILYNMKSSRNRLNYLFHCILSFADDIAYLLIKDKACNS